MDRSALEDSLRVLAARWRGGEGHPAPGGLVAYRAGDLTAEENDRIQEHLTQCRDCARLLLDLAEFEQLTPPPEELGPVDTRAEASWRRLRARLRDEDEPEEQPAPQHRPRSRVPLWRQTAIPWTLAAGLALCVMGLGLRMATLQQRLADLSVPQSDVGELNNRGKAPGADRVGDSSVLLLHLPVDSSDFTAYEAEFLPASGEEPVFQTQRGQEQSGILTLQPPPSSLPPDSYAVQLYGLTGGRLALLDRYLFEISPVLFR